MSVAKKIGLHTVALTGRTGGNLKNMVDHCICAPSDETPRIQECHILIGHIISELVEGEPSMKKAAFLDRDGVINRKPPEDQYVTQ